MNYPHFPLQKGAWIEWVSEWMFVCVCVCVCVWERERDECGKVRANCMSFDGFSSSSSFSPCVWISDAQNNDRHSFGHFFFFFFYRFVSHQNLAARWHVCALTGEWQMAAICGLHARERTKILPPAACDSREPAARRKQLISRPASACMLHRNHQ